MPKYIHDGGSSIFTLLSKKLVRPFGYKKIRTSTGSFQTISASSRGKGFKFFGPFRTKSTGNLTKRMNYMNKRISGKTQKVEGYSFKLKEAQLHSKSRFNNYSKQINEQKDKITKLNDLKAKGIKLNPRELRELKKAESSVRSLKRTQKSIAQSYVMKSAKLKGKMNRAQARLNYKVTKYAAKQKKYKALMERKIYKSQKRLDKGFTKTCKNLKKTGKSAIGCLEAFEKCKSQGHGLNLEKMTGCVNAESLAQGLPSGLKQGDITTTMTKLANKHFLRRFKRGRHLREISRITSGKGAKLQTSMNETAKTLQYGKVLGQTQTVSGVGALSKARTRQLTGQNIVPGTGVKDFSDPRASKIFARREGIQSMQSANALQKQSGQLSNIEKQMAKTDHFQQFSKIGGPTPELLGKLTPEADKWLRKMTKVPGSKKLIDRFAPAYSSYYTKLANERKAAFTALQKKYPNLQIRTSPKGLQFNKSNAGVVNPNFRDPNSYGLVGPSQGPGYLKISPSSSTTI